MSKPSKRKWVDITDLLTPNGIQALKDGKDIGIKVGQILTFDYEGSRTYLRVVRLDRIRGKLWAIDTKLYTRDEFEVVDV